MFGDPVRHERFVTVGKMGMKNGKTFILLHPFLPEIKHNNADFHLYGFEL